MNIFDIRTKNSFPFTSFTSRKYKIVISFMLMAFVILITACQNEETTAADPDEVNSEEEQDDPSDQHTEEESEQVDHNADSNGETNL